MNSYSKEHQEDFCSQVEIEFKWSDLNSSIKRLTIIHVNIGLTVGSIYIHICLSVLHICKTLAT